MLSNDKVTQLAHLTMVAVQLESINAIEQKKVVLEKIDELLKSM